MTRGRQRLSTCELRASNIMTRQEDIKIFAELGRTTPARAPSSRTAVMVARRPARLPSKVRAEEPVHLVLPSVEPNTAATVSNTPTERRPAYRLKWAGWRW